MQHARLFCPWGSPGKDAGVGCHFLLTELNKTRLLQCPFEEERVTHLLKYLRIQENSGGV